MTTIDRDRLRRYLSHAAMLLPPDERVVTVAEGAGMLDALSAAERRATRAEAQAETRRQQTAYWQERAEEAEAERDEAEKVHRDLTSSLGFGDDITEPMAGNKTIIEHVSQAVTDSQELWELTQAKCAEAGCDTEEDCYTHHPERRAERAEARIQAVRDVLSADEQATRQMGTLGQWQPDTPAIAHDTIRHALDGDNES